jgi:ClpP class serine protease
MIACAGDEIFADPSSLVGSIGVISAGFGFHELIEKLGIERRVHTAGQSKAMLDPFRPELADDVARLKLIQADVHAMFVGLVRGRRGPKLKESDTLFSGAVWSGAEAVSLGLVDAVGDLRAVLRERFGDTVRLAVVPQSKPGLIGRLIGRGETPLSRSLVDPAEVLATLEERAAFARLGL